MTRRVIATAGAACALLLAGTASGSAASYPASARFGGASGSIDTPAKVVGLLQATRHDSNDQLRATLNGLSPSDRSYVIKEGFTPAKSKMTMTERRVYAGSHRASTMFARRGEARRRLRAHVACVHPNYNWSKSFQARIYNPVGWTIYEYQSNWQWGGGCDNVVYAHHQETSTYTMPGWQYNGSSYGAPYGQIGTHMVGRETFGHFAYVINGVVDNTMDMQVQVNGNPGWWVWWRATGFGT
jgi:hypothetical protein